jgi:hypothetical protein
MPCLLVLIGVFFPRVLIALLFLFTDWLATAYADVPVIWPVLGFLVMPFTTLAYALAMHGAGQVEGIYLIILIVAVLMDVGAWGGGAHQRR